jgi:hypothetical protein
MTDPDAETIASLSASIWRRERRRGERIAALRLALEHDHPRAWALAQAVEAAHPVFSLREEARQANARRAHERSLPPHLWADRVAARWPSDDMAHPTDSTMRALDQPRLLEMVDTTNAPFAQIGRERFGPESLTTCGWPALRRIGRDPRQRSPMTAARDRPRHSGRRPERARSIAGRRAPRWNRRLRARPPYCRGGSRAPERGPRHPCRTARTPRRSSRGQRRRLRVGQPRITERRAQVLPSDFTEAQCIVGEWQPWGTLDPRPEGLAPPQSCPPC